MTPINKFLLTFNILAAMIAMALLTTVYRTHRNWEALTTGPKPSAAMPFDVQDNSGAIPTLERHRKRFNELQSQFIALQKTLAERQVYGAKNVTVKAEGGADIVINVPGLQEVALMETRRDMADEEANRITNVNLSPEAVQSRTDLVAQNQAASDELISQQDLLAGLRDDIMQFRRERDAIFVAMVAASSQVNSHIEEIKPVRAGLDKLVDVYTRARAVAARFAVSIRPRPALGEVANEGTVLASSARGLVVVSLGADDGVLPGQQMIVFRHGKLASQFLGKIEIVSTEPEKSIGRVLPNFKRGAIERNDRVKRPD
jgi:hypothetical protein